MERLLERAAISNEEKAELLVRQAKDKLREIRQDFLELSHIKNRYPIYEKDWKPIYKVMNERKAYYQGAIDKLRAKYKV